MLILGIESAASVAGAALIRDGIVLAEYTTNFKMTHSQTLLPMIDSIVNMTQTDLHELDAIAVSAGPGSYTGLRIGSATAKGLGLALQKPLISVPTLAAMAYQCWGTGFDVCPIMDARRGQVYTATYRFDQKQELETVDEPELVLMTDRLLLLKERQRPVLFTGDAVENFSPQICEMLPGAVFAPAHINRQRAAAVAVLGEIMYLRGETETAAEHIPQYLRRTQAERERETRLGKEENKNGC